MLQALAEEVLNGGEGGDDRGAAEPVRDEREVREVTLDRRVEQDLRPGVAQGRSVLVQQIHQLLRDLLGRLQQLLAPICVMRFVMLPAQVLRYLASREFRFAHVPADKSRHSSYFCHLQELYDAMACI